MLTNTFGFCKPVDLGSNGAQEEEDKGMSPGAALVALREAE